jgi:hypothetical protein
MVRDGVEWFGNTESWNITIQAPPPAQLIQNGDFSSGLTGWTVWNERGNGNPSVVNGELRLSGDFNGGVYQQFQTGGAGAVVKVNGFWVGEATAAARWAEVLIINGSRLPVAGQDVHSGQSDVVLLYKNDRSAGWSGQMSDTATVANVGSFTASGSVATILLKAGSWGGAAVTRYDNLTVERTAAPPGPSLPDVVVESIALAPASPRDGDAVSFSALVKNVGSGPTPNGVTLGVGYTVLQGQTVVHQTWGAVAGPLAAGASVTVGTSGAAFSATAGDFAVEAKVDDVNRFEESNENNNLRSLSFTVADAAPPVLRVGRIGFHVGPGGNQTGLGDWMRRLDAAGIPFFLKSADSAGQIYEAARLREVSGVSHILVYRKSGAEYDVPNYNLPPAQAAAQHWERHRAVFPPELLPYKHMIWLETMNEVDKNRAEWLAEFSRETALRAMNEGFNWAAFGWSSGEPEPNHWEGPQMLAFLRLAAENPERVAVALHEYSFTIARIDEGYPFLVGRFQKLFEVADRNGFARPTVLVTEFGWEYQTVPEVGTAMEHIRWADELYEKHPQFKGAGIWYLGPGYGGISNLAQKLIQPVTDYYLAKYPKTP